MKQALVTLLFLSCALPKPEALETPKTPMVSSSLNDTVALVNEGLAIYCAGVIIDGYVATAAHCVDRGENVLVGQRGLTEVPIDLAWYTRIHFDEVQDLAILERNEGNLRIGRSLAPLPPKDGDMVVAIGHPLGLAWTITVGVVSREERFGGPEVNTHWFQISPGLAPGNSGGPIYNKYGEVVGIASFMMKGYPHLGGAVHWAEINKALRKVQQ